MHVNMHAYIKNISLIFFTVYKKVNTKNQNKLIRNNQGVT